MSEVEQKDALRETSSDESSSAERKPPFYITKDEESLLRVAANGMNPSLVITQSASFDEYVRQLMIPTIVMEMARKAANLRLGFSEVEAIRASIDEGDGILRYILDKKAEGDKSHPPYIRVAASGKGDFDDDAEENLAKKSGLLTAAGQEHKGDYGSPVVLEIWPAGHYSPIHSHGDSTGIIYCLTGQIDVMVYDRLDWNAGKVGLLTLTPGQCAWLTDQRFAVHKVYCPMAEGGYAATFHVYLNQDEMPLLLGDAAPKPHTRDIFMFVDEDEPHAVKEFATYSDLSWRILRREIAYYAARLGT